MDHKKSANGHIVKAQDGVFRNCKFRTQEDTL